MVEQNVNILNVARALSSSSSVSSTVPSLTPPQLLCDFETESGDDLEDVGGVLEEPVVLPASSNETTEAGVPGSATGAPTAGVPAAAVSEEMQGDVGESSSGGCLVGNEQLGRGQQTRLPSVKLRDFVTDTNQKCNPSPSSSLSSSKTSGTRYPIAHSVNYNRFSVGHRTFLTCVEPKSSQEAMLHLEWCEAMQKEITALEDNGTWSMVEGINYHDTFAPVAKMVTVRTFLAVAAMKQWELHQMDVHNAFLHEDLS
ncbi:hypothetical protein LIER_18203 [Lithospermum erythrorhizon]|uniref:Reverse transcriptase Ty1/copia-type domain-containing protein n=1 Tax=Lithospermum erythrorhizon TaxID=34254 RepID=A0AAV3QIL1_LITER